MNVEIVTFPQTRVAALTHRGSPLQEHDTARKLIAWKIENRLLDPVKNRSYGLHYADPTGPDASKYRVDFCLSVDGPIAPNPHGIVEMTIPQLRCARARDVGSRNNNQAARYLLEQWLPSSGERLSGYPLIFHYVNVGPNIPAHEAITDVYMPLEGSGVQMSADPVFKAAFPYQKDVLALPVTNLDIASQWYCRAFGMVEVERRTHPLPAVVLERDGVRIGFELNGGDASQDGAAIRVSGISRLREELEARGVETGNWRVDERNGQKLQVFFVTAPDGLCYYFHEPV